jgi:hypothetical protein
VSPPQALYFWHIPKTAGTSFIEWLDSHFTPNEIFHPQLVPQLRATPEEQVQGRLLYRGHLGLELPRRLSAPVAAVTLLREPRARTLSHLAHIWREPNHYLHRRIRQSEGDLRAVLADPLLRLAVTDVQARYLAVDPRRTLNVGLPLPVREELAAQAQFELASLPQRARLVTAAVARLSRLAAFGFAERLDDFAVRIAERQSWPTPATLPRSNSSAARSAPWNLSDLNARGLRLLDEVNRADLVVYSLAHGFDRISKKRRWSRAS